MIKIMVVGLPGNMANVFANHALNTADISLIPYSITGPEIEEVNTSVGGKMISLVNSGDKEAKDALVDEQKPFIAVDFTEPRAVEQNIDYYCRRGINFVMGTTGVVMNRISEKIKEAGINAVISPNMAKQIVALQAMMEFAADAFPECFAGYKLDITESHQKGKLDTSGTARAMLKCFNKLGLKYDENLITKIRDPQVQLKMGVPESAIEGHGWHTYSLVSPNGTVFIQLVHNISGRDVYAVGTLDSIRFLDGKIRAGEKGKVYSMIDVLKQG